jgi:hypothetical protein
MKTPKSFKDLNVQVDSTAFEGTKLDINAILNREVTVHKFKNAPSKFPEKNPVCLHLQISIGGVMHVVFSGSRVLQQTIERLAEDDFPFTTTIVRDNRRFQFS